MVGHTVDQEQWDQRADDQQGESDFPNAFFINSLGMITTADSIDYEQNSVYEFTILALDSGSPRLTGTTINSRNSSRKSEQQPASVHAFAQEQTFAQENTPKNMTRWLSGSLDRDWEVIYHTCDVMNLFILLHFYCLFYYHSTTILLSHPIIQHLRACKALNKN